jgi:hypothetical protein
MIHAVIRRHCTTADVASRNERSKREDRRRGRNWIRWKARGMQVFTAHAKHYDECNDIRYPCQTFKPVQGQGSVVGGNIDDNTRHYQCNVLYPKKVTWSDISTNGAWNRQIALLTTNDTTLMITIPAVSFKRSETLASIWPPVIQFRIRNPCIENTFSILGMTDPKYLRKDVRHQTITNTWHHTPKRTAPGPLLVFLTWVQKLHYG